MGNKIVMKRNGSTRQGTLNKTLAGATLASAGASDTGGSGLELLTPADFTLDAYYDMTPQLYTAANVPGGGATMSYGSGFTFRRDNGQLRLLFAFGGWWTSGPDVYEINFENLTAGGTINQSIITNAWLGTTLWNNQFTFSPRAGDAWGGLFVDPDDNTTIWNTGIPSFEASGESIIAKATLGPGGTASNFNVVSLRNVKAPRVGYGFTKIPAWFQSTYGTGPIMVGFGGGGRDYQPDQSLGFSAVAIPDISGYANGAIVEATDFKVLGDHTTAGIGQIPRTTDWWNDGSGLTAPNAFDRGKRRPGFVYNFLNGGNAYNLNGAHSLGGWMNVRGNTIYWSDTCSNPTHPSANFALQVIQRDIDVVSSTGNSIQFGANAQANLFDYSWGNAATWIRVTSGTGSGVDKWYCVKTYNPSTKVMTVGYPQFAVSNLSDIVDTDVTPALDSTSKVVCGHWADTPYNVLLDTGFWPGATFIQDGVNIFVRPPAAIQPGTEPLPVIQDAIPQGSAWEQAYVTSADKQYKVTLDSAPSFGDADGVIWQTPSAKPMVYRDDRQQWAWRPNNDLGGPDNAQRWIYGDQYWGAGTWIRGTTKEGFVALLDAGMGRAWFNNGARINVEGFTTEMHIYNPVHFGECAGGSRASYNVQPVHMAPIEPLSSDVYANSQAAIHQSSIIYRMHSVPRGSAANTWFDSVNKKYYVVVPVTSASTIRVYKFSVNC